MVLEIYIKLCVAGPDFLKKKFFLPKNLGKWENGSKMAQKQGFLNLLKNLVFIFY